MTEICLVVKLVNFSLKKFLHDWLQFSIFFQHIRVQGMKMFQLYIHLNVIVFCRNHFNIIYILFVKIQCLEMVKFRRIFNQIVINMYSVPDHWIFTNIISKLLFSQRFWIIYINNFMTPFCMRKFWIQWMAWSYWLATRASWNVIYKFTMMK